MQKNESKVKSDLSKENESDIKKQIRASINDFLFPFLFKNQKNEILILTISTTNQIKEEDYYSEREKLAFRERKMRVGEREREGED